ncbi:MAG: class I SAM-dependent methyltransferase [Alphaproteobacteria bacterium]|nr:class I SAM-dependent methyltransferase [Alphaproteobacteria bacterium]
MTDDPILSILRALPGQALQMARRDALDALAGQARETAAALSPDDLGTFDALFAMVLRYRTYLILQSLGPFLGDAVRHGLFEGLRMLPESFGSHPLPRRIGCYEREIQTILAARAPCWDRVVDIGCAEGWYLAGLARRFGLPCQGFDVAPSAWRLARANAALNGVEALVTVAERPCGGEELASLATPRTLFIVDIEGAETDLFAQIDPERLARAEFIIETHGGSAAPLAERLGRGHRIELVWPGPRPIEDYPTLWRLQEIDRSLAIWEGRGLDPWLHCVPR